MKPTTRLRWLVRQNTPPTAAEVRAYVAQYGVAMMDAKRILHARQPPVLQQWHEVEGWEHDDYLAAGGEWRDVETEFEALPPP